MFRSGYWLLGRWRGAPIKLHLSLLVGLLLLGGFRWRPGFFLAYPCLILVHELGHAALVWRTGHRVLEIDVTGFGGSCHWSGNASPFEGALIAWGGVLAQLTLYGGTTLCLWAWPPSSALAADVAFTFTVTNVWLIALNLLPIPPFDGARAWGIFRAFRGRTTAGLPRGTWRDHSCDAQRVWFDKLQSTTHPTRRSPSRVADGQQGPEGPLSLDAQQAVDRLVKSVTGKARHSTRGDRPR